MLARERLLKRILHHLTFLSVHAELLGKIHFFDLNIAAEHFYQKFLNQVYGFHLANLNHTQINAAAIDLADPTTRLAVQVTSQRSALKIRKTLDSFVKHGLGTTYTTLKIVIIGKRTGTYSTVLVPAGVSFDGLTDVIDNASLIKDIAKKSTQDLQSILDVMECEIDYNKNVVSVMDKTDEDSILDLRSLMDRPAFQDPWSYEVNYLAFQEAITGLIETINTGRSAGMLFTKPRFAYKDKNLSIQLSAVYTQLRSLRQLFQYHLKTGEIDLTSNTCNFEIPQSEVAFDAQQNAINAKFNAIMAQFNYTLLPNVS